jgi:hypothetical protein
MNVRTDRSTIDFDAVARRIVELTDLNLIREQLVLVWNARGAADIAKGDVGLSALMGDTAGRPIIKHLARALRRLDR